MSMLAVEVRQGTLGGDTRAGRAWSWLRSGRDYWVGMLVVEVREGTLGGHARG